MQNEELQGQLRKLIDGVMNGKMSRREAIRRAPHSAVASR